MDIEDLRARFEHHPPTTPEVVEAHETTRKKFVALALYFNKLLPDGRDKSVLMTKLDEACQAANAAIARTQLRRE